MNPRSHVLEVDLATIPDGVGIAARTVVALPPSDLDPSIVVGGTGYDSTTAYDATTTYFATYLFDQMRVYVNGALVLRDYDPEVA